MVTAEGDIVRASADDHPDLFWALRGGGGNFGVVSSFRFALHPVGPTVIAGPVFWAAEDTTDVMRFYREFVADAPDELGTVIRLGTIPPLPVISHELHFRPAIAVACCYAGPVEDGERAVRALRRFGTPLVDLVGPTRYVDHQSGLDDTVPHGWHYYWKATNLTGLSDEVIDVVAEHAYRARSPRSYAAMFHMGGAVARVPRRHGVSRPRRRPQHRHRRRWLADEDDTVGTSETGWARDSSKLSNPTAPASTSTSSTPTTTPAEFARPTATTPTCGSPRSRRRYDPENVFHNNKNIHPAPPRPPPPPPPRRRGPHRPPGGRGGPVPAAAPPRSGPPRGGGAPGRGSRRGPRAPPPPPRPGPPRGPAGRPLPPRARAGGATTSLRRAPRRGPPPDRHVGVDRIPLDRHANPNPRAADDRRRHQRGRPRRRVSRRWRARRVRRRRLDRPRGVGTHGTSRWPAVSRWWAGSSISTSGWRPAVSPSRRRAHRARSGADLAAGRPGTSWPRPSRRSSRCRR